MLKLNIYPKSQAAISQIVPNLFACSSSSSFYSSDFSEAAKSLIEDVVGLEVFEVVSA